MLQNKVVTLDPSYPSYTDNKQRDTAQKQVQGVVRAADLPNGGALVDFGYPKLLRVPQEALRV